MDTNYYVNLSVEDTNNLLKKLDKIIKHICENNESSHIYMELQHYTIYKNIIPHDDDVILQVIKSNDFLEKFKLLKQYPYMLMYFYNTLVHLNKIELLVNLANDDKDINNLELYIPLLLDIDYKDFDTSKLLDRVKKHADIELINKMYTYAKLFDGTKYGSGDFIFVDNFFLNNFNINP